MAIDQERAFLNKKFFRDAKDPKLLAAIESMLDEHAIAINIGQLCQILRAYAAECVRAERLRCAGIARNHHVIHGDHYAAYSAPSNDGADIAKAIEKEG